jgi:hypothetical protein
LNQLFGQLKTRKLSGGSESAPMRTCELTRRRPD